MRTRDNPFLPPFHKSIKTINIRKWSKNKDFYTQQLCLAVVFVDDGFSKNSKKTWMWYFLKYWPMFSSNLIQYLFDMFLLGERNNNLIGYKDINVFFLELFSIKLIHLFDQYLTQFMWPLNPIQSMFFRMKKWIYRLIIPRLFLNLSNYTLWWLVREMES